MTPPTASFNLTIPSTGQTSVGTSMLAHYVLSKATAGKASYSGGGGGGGADASVSPDFSPPPVSAQHYPIVRQPAPGMSTTTKVAIAGGVVVALGLVFLLTRK